MWDFSSDEWLFFVVAGLITARGLIVSCRGLLPINRFRHARAPRLVMALTPLLCCIWTCFIIQCFADPQVRGHADYVILFLLGQCMWLAATAWGIRLLGVSVSGDVLERANPAALWFAAGAMLATSIIYAASNIGSGPTIWTTIVPAAVCTLGLGALWILANRIGGSVLDAITIDRDVASGARMAGAAIGCAVILGRSAAGQWVSWSDTFDSMLRLGWPAAALALAAGLVHRLMRPTPAEPVLPWPTYGLLPGAIFVLGGLLVVVLQGHALEPSRW